jgi:hypothetical protein
LAKQTVQDVPTDLSTSTYVILSDKPNSICRVARTTVNGIELQEFVSWRSTKRIFRYRHSIHEMVIMRPANVRDFVMVSFDRDQLDERENYRRAPNLQRLRGFVKRWGMDWLVEYLRVCSTFQFQPAGLRGRFERTDADVNHFTQVITDTRYRRLLASKAKCPMIRQAFAAALGKPLKLVS